MEAGEGGGRMSSWTVYKTLPDAEGVCQHRSEKWQQGSFLNPAWMSD